MNSKHNQQFYFLIIHQILVNQHEKFYYDFKHVKPFHCQFSYKKLEQTSSMFM
jgi:hypothetical protein